MMPQHVQCVERSCCHKPSLIFSAFGFTTGLESAESFSVSNGPTLLRGVSELDILKL